MIAYGSSSYGTLMGCSLLELNLCKLNVCVIQFFPTAELTGKELEDAREDEPLSLLQGEELSNKHE